MKKNLRIVVLASALFVCAAAQSVTLSITQISMVDAKPQLRIQSDTGITNQVQYKTSLSQGAWEVLTNLLVAQSPYVFVDMTAPVGQARFYQVMAFTAPVGMALIPAGSFTMGNCMNPAEGWSDELPLHTNFVSAFYMDTNLVSYMLWTNVYQWATNHGYSFGSAGAGKAANHPVQMVNWYDAVKWCNARSEREGREPAYYTDAGLSVPYRSGELAPSVKWGTGYRLPTEAEWEKAARGGVSGQRFPWGNTISWNEANYMAAPSLYAYDTNPTAGYPPAFNDGVTPYTSPVGYFAPNGYGLCDMVENVAQWCWDWYADYSSSSQTDPRGPASGLSRVMRGGAWAQNAKYCRTAYRGYSPLEKPEPVIGFRSVLSAGQ